jgi:hypothetical protein
MLRQKNDDGKQSASSVGHVDSHGSAPVQYGVNPLMQHVQGYTGSHWLPPSGNYSLRIALVAAKATANETKMKNAPSLLAVPMAAVLRRYDTGHIT